MNATATKAPGQDLARDMSLFEIDEALALLIESAQEEAAKNGGDIPEELQAALGEYIEAFGEKVDRIAGYLKAQDAFAELAKKEEERLRTRRNAAENRVKRLKSFLCFWMAARGCNRLKGRLNTITLAKNSLDTLVIEDGAAIPDRYHKVVVQIGWDDWEYLLDLVPRGPERDRLARGGVKQKELDRAHVEEAIKDGIVLPGVQLVRGQHVRLS
jgi:hypothetical protein